MHIKKNINQHGFTIVELLIVVVVIAVLAAITVVAFNGISTRAKIQSLATDLNQSFKKIETFKINDINNNYPGTLAAAGLSGTSTKSYQYTVDNVSVNKAFCLTVSEAGFSYFVNSANSKAQVGACPGHANAFVIAPVNGGVVTTIATSAEGINDPRGLVVDSDGNIFINNAGTTRILKITPSGVVSVFAGSGTNATVDGTGVSASFNSPGGLAIDSQNNLYLGECNGHKIRKITPAAVVSTFAGSSYGYLDGTSNGARFYCPQGVAVGPSDVVYVADGNNNRIRMITQAGVVTTLSGSGTAGTLDGSATTSQFNGPVGIAVDQAGNVYVNDDSSSRVKKVAPDGTVTTFVGSGVSGFADGTGVSAQVNTGRANLSVDNAGNVYLADGANHRLRKITQAGVVTTLAGSGVGGTGDGTGLSAQFSYPRNIFITPSGTIYVNDNSTNRIRKIQ